MGKIRKTKTELKAQRDALRRFEKYLPTLELKKQQLRIEVSHMSARIDKKRKEKRKLWQEVMEWVRLFSDDVPLENLVEIESVDIGSDNIAGVDIPVIQSIEFKRAPVDLFATPPFIDDAMDVIERLVRFEIEEQILHLALTRLSEELRITSQRVNLFEKVKIPESKDNIRRIHIALGDAQAAAVARAKMAKKKSIERSSSAL